MACISEVMLLTMRQLILQPLLSHKKLKTSNSASFSHKRSTRSKPRAKVASDSESGVSTRWGDI